MPIIILVIIFRRELVGDYNHDVDDHEDDVDDSNHSC